MTHWETTEPGDSAERECEGETEKTRMTTAYRVEFVSPYDGRPRSCCYETLVEARRKETKLLATRVMIVEMIRFTNG